MEDDKKKKRNKKKKNKQNKTTEEVAVGADQNPVTTGHNDDIGGQAFEKADIQNGQVDLDRHQTNGTESVSLDLIDLESPKFIWRSYLSGFMIHF